MTPAKQFNRISELLSFLADNTITKDQLEELDKAVVGNIEAEEFCVDWLMNYDSLQRFGSVFFESARQVEDTIIREYLPGQLDKVVSSDVAEVPGGFDTDLWEALGQNEKTAEPVEIEPVVAGPIEPVYVDAVNQRKISKLSIYTFIVSAAALLFIVAIALLTSPSLPVVATVGDSINANWSGLSVESEDGSLEYGAELRQGNLALMSGVAKIVMLDGAEVVLKGPAVVELETAGRLKLTHGKLFAKVPKGAEGFTVRTNSATVVDYGTEFGVAVDDEGATETHVFQGMVKLAPVATDDKTAKMDSVELTAGQAGQVQDGDIKHVKFHRHAFTAYVPTAYELAVKKKRPMSYWRLKPGAAQSLINLADESTVKVRYNGIVDLVDGPFPNHSDVCSAVKFYGDDSYLFIPQVDDRQSRSGGQEKPKKYTFMLWVRADSVGNQVIASRTNRMGSFHRVVGITEDGRFNYIYWDKNRSKALFRLEADSLAQAGLWYHVAVSIDKKSFARLYINGAEQGRPVKISDLSLFYPARFVGQRHVGSLPEDVTIEGYHSFNGAVADIVEYDRLLSGKEIRSLYLSVKKNKF